MNWEQLQQVRLAVIARLVSQVPPNLMGRTMLMKLCYFLQEVKNVPLGYNFTIYSYGPFDSDVLSDLGTAVNLEGVRSTVAYNSVGYGYRLETGPNLAQLLSEGDDFLRQHQDSLKWVIEEFSQKSASDLELESTIVFVDHEAAARKETLTIGDLAAKVNRLKPHFKTGVIAERALRLTEKQLLST